MYTVQTGKKMQVDKKVVNIFVIKYLNDLHILLPIITFLRDA